jgi:hypothetical protein
MIPVLIREGHGEEIGELRMLVEYMIGDVFERLRR